MELCLLAPDCGRVFHGVPAQCDRNLGGGGPSLAWHQRSRQCAYAGDLLLSRLLQRIGEGGRDWFCSEHAQSVVPGACNEDHLFRSTEIARSQIEAEQVERPESFKTLPVQHEASVQRIFRKEAPACPGTGASRLRHEQQLGAATSFEISLFQKYS